MDPYAHRYSGVSGPLTLLGPDYPGATFAQHPYKPLGKTSPTTVVHFDLHRGMTKVVDPFAGKPLEKDPPYIKELYGERISWLTMPGTKVVRKWRLW